MPVLVHKVAPTPAHAHASTCLRPIYSQLGPDNPSGVLRILQDKILSMIERILICYLID